MEQEKTQMQAVTEYPDNLFSWVDLSTSDLEGAKVFYGGLFGWQMDDRPTDVGTIYTMCLLDGKSVAGMGPMQPDMQAAGMPPVWMSYVKHDDVDAVAAKASAAGGTLMMPPMDVMQEGRMALIQDPTGAAFGVWQPKNHIGAQLVNMPNTLVWNELQTNDVEEARAFYTAVFGWTYSVDEGGYIVASAGDRAQAGVMAIQESWGEVPPNWTVYFMVDDLDASVAKAGELGGNAMPPIAAGDMGRFSVVQDPQGGYFTMMELSGPVDAPPGT